MLLSIVINYTFGMLIDKSHENKILAKLLLILAVAGNLGILFYFKYLNFTITTVNSVFHSGFALRDIVMPIGISFFTFQGMSYVIDLYWRKVDVQKNPAKLAFYISFFPQLIAGPIVRYIDIKEQIEKRTVSIEKFAAGMQRLVIGLAKKLIIANTLGEIADMIFDLPVSEIGTATAWLGIICYTFQIFFDFSGYSDIAIGLGKMFGFEFLENFNYPYISKSITEFWRRWHISLSSWFRDYVYIPLGGSRKGNVYVNLLFVFALVGIWHGANFTFLAWGLWNGLFLCIERFFGIREVKNKRNIPIRYITTMLIVVVGMVFARSPSMRYALRYIGTMFGFVRPEFEGLTIEFFLSPKIIIMLCLAAAASTPLLKTAFTSIKHKPVVYGLILALLLVCMVFVTGSSYNPFIYFRF
jgi:alginate O-acetyltransferase complex protein AlgI